MNALFSNPLVIVLGFAALAVLAWWIVTNTPRAPSETDQGLGWSTNEPVAEDKPLVFETTEVAVETLPTVDAEVPLDVKVEAALVEVTTPAETAPIEAPVTPKRTAKRAPKVEAAPAVVETEVAPISGTAKPVRKPRAPKAG